MTISYRMTAMDNFYFYSYLLGKTYLGKIFLVFMLALPVLMYAVRFYLSPPNSPMEHMLLAHFRGIIAISYVLAFLSVGIVLLLVSAMVPKRTVVIDERFCYIKDFPSVKSPWRRFY